MADRFPAERSSRTDQAIRAQLQFHPGSPCLWEGSQACRIVQRDASKQIGDLTGGYLQTAHAQFHEQIDALRVKSGGEKDASEV